MATIHGKPEHTSIILSGVEGDRHFETALRYGRSKNLLVSFLYAEKKGTAWFKNRATKHPDVKWTVDSGAHSFRTEGYCTKWPDLAWFDDYATRFKAWLIENKEYLDFTVNLDVDTPCGMSEMIRWDNDIFRPLEREGVPVCYVYHEKYGFDYWLKMCREHSFVGLPGHWDTPEYHKFLKPAIMNGCRVHGFAATKAHILGKVPFSSCDSISWKSGEMYGQTFVFENGSLRTYDKNQKNERLKYKARWTSLGIDWDELEQDKAEPITQVCATAWADYQDHVATMTRKLAYWNKTSVLVDDLIAQNGSVNNLTKEMIKEFYDRHQFNLDVTSDVSGRQDLLDIQAFLARDNRYVFGLTDDRIKYWLAVLRVDPEHNSRPEYEASIRQHLYKFFYKLKADDALPRLDLSKVIPLSERMPEERTEDIPEAPRVGVDLPIFPGAASMGGTDQLPPSFLLSSGQESTPVEPALVVLEAPDFERQAGPEVLRSDGHESQEKPSGTSAFKSFLASVDDDFLRSRVGYGVDLVFHQNKLKYEVNRLKMLRREPKKQKELAQKVAKLAVEVTSLCEEAGPSLAAKMKEAGEAAFQAWLDVGAAKDDAESKKALDEKAKALNPQARALVENPALASALGKLGGAPKGNQNARKHGLYSPKLPQMACDNCPHIQVCPQYRAGHVCAFLNEFSSWVAASKNPEMDMLQDLLQTTIQRYRRALMYETFEGGAPSKEVTRLSAMVAALLKQLADLKNPRPTIQVGLPAVAAAPSQAPGEGPLASLFRDLRKGPDGTFAAPPAPQPAKAPAQ